MNQMTLIPGLELNGIEILPTALQILNTQTLTLIVMKMAVTFIMDLTQMASTMRFMKSIIKAKII
jgi:hypothetical protein